MQKTDALIGLAHGSRHALTVEVTHAIVQRAGDLIGAPDRAADAYLDLAEPTLQQAAEDFTARGIGRAVVVPLLFTQAYHATSDVPEELEKVSASTGMELVAANILGTGDDILDVLVNHIAEHKAVGELILMSVGSSHASANEDVADLAKRLQARHGSAVHTGFATCVPYATDIVDRIADAGGSATVVPLFTATGLLLDKVDERAAQRGMRALPPLAEKLAAIIADRCRSALDA